MSKYLEKVRDMLCEELDEIAEDGKLTAGKVEEIDKLTHSIKSIDTILAMREGGYSSRGFGYPRYYYDHDHHYDDGYSDARKRDARGRYSSADEHEHMIRELHDAMNMAKDSAVREDIRRLIDKVERM